MNLKCKPLKLKANINSRNGQINFSVPKKKVSQELLDKVYSGKKIRLVFEDDD